MPVARLDSRALIAVTGPDARPFLHNLLTQSVEDMADNEVRFGALLTPQGRLLFDLFLHAQPDGVLVECAAERRTAMIQRLSMYRLRAVVGIQADERPVFAAWGDASIGSPDPRLPGLGRRGVGEVTADAPEAAWLAHQLVAGVPNPSTDTRLDADYPIEANWDLLSGIDFRKGCFIGQETTSRMKRRGTIKTRLAPLVFEGPSPEPGAEVLKGELRAGEIRSGVEGRAMALLRLDRIDGDLTVEGRPVRADLPRWLTGES